MEGTLIFRRKQMLPLIQYFLLLDWLLMKNTVSANLYICPFSPQMGI